MSRYAEQVRAMLEEGRAIWMWRGPLRPDLPHALLTSGMHSDGYADVGSFLKNNPRERGRIAYCLSDLIDPDMTLRVTAVVGADTSSTALAGDLAKSFDAKHLRMIKAEAINGKFQVWHPDNPPIGKDDVILQVEELITTTTSARRVRDGIAKAHPGVIFTYAPVLPVVVDRSHPDNRIREFQGSTIMPLLELDIRHYKPDEECPYCAVGSEAIKPKEGNNWQRLMAT